MFVALRETFDVDPNGKATRVFPGQEVKTFMQWPARNQMAALSAKFVREVPDGTQLTDEELFCKKPDPASVRESKARVLAQASTPAVSTPVAVPVAKVAFEELEQVPQPEAHLCKDCAFSSPSARGLAIHRGRDHKGS